MTESQLEAFDCAIDIHDSSASDFVVEVLEGTNSDLDASAFECAIDIPDFGASMVSPVFDMRKGTHNDEDASAFECAINIEDSGVMDVSAFDVCKETSNDDDASAFDIAAPVSYGGMPSRTPELAALQFKLAYEAQLKRTYNTEEMYALEIYY